MLTLTAIPTAASTLFSVYASFSAALTLIRSIFNELIPQSLQTYIYNAFSQFFTPSPSDLTVIIAQESGMTVNEVYGAAELFLRNKMGPNTERLRVSKTQREKNFTVLIEQGEEIADEFDGFQLRWRFVCVQASNKSEKRSFELTFKKKLKDRVIDSYLPYVLDRAQRIKDDERVVRLFSRHCPYDPDEYGSGSWGSIELEHPSTFETLAMDPELKKSIIEDLDRFLRRKEFYKRVGKAWKRGYLLYGPPGTGKSSLIAAMANYLKFDIYDLELTSIHSNSDLRYVLLSTTNKSVLVIEDVDCSAEMIDREDDFNRPNSKFTLSGLLNFIDGLWSSCGDERIIVFTTNYKDRLDPALLRPGRMDVHISMSYCSGQGFKILASNYLGLPETCQNPLYQQVQSLIDTTEVSPAEVAEELMGSDDSDVALKGLADFLKRKAERVDENKDEDVKEEKTKKRSSGFARNIRKFFKRKDNIE